MNNRLIFWFGIVIFMLLPCFVQADIDGIVIETKTPRNYGYTLGDQITLIANIKVPMFYHLETGQLPKPGMLNEWLNLVSIDLTDPEEGQDYSIKITYQLFKSVPTVTELTLPPLPLQFRHQGQTTNKEIPAWKFGYSPLISGSEIKQNQEPEPELPATQLATSDSIRIFYALAAVIVLLIVYLIWFYGKAPFFERYDSAFGRACRKIKALKKQSPTPEIQQTALLCFHRALNELAGKTVFSDQLTVFFKEFPHFLPLQEQTAQLFDLSQQVFFNRDNNDHAQVPMQQIEHLCLQYRKLERGFRWL